MDDPRQRNLATGAVLILLGVGLFALQILEGPGETVTLFLIGGLFIAGYLYRRAYGLLIPGGILLGIGLGSVGERAGLSFGDLGAIGLGIGFLSIYVIALVVQGHSPWWPLVPGLILVVTGLAQGSVTLDRLISIGWPLVLILAGLLVLAGAFGRRGQSNDEEEAPIDIPDPK
jgi:hypothetical protein